MVLEQRTIERNYEKMASLTKSKSKSPVTTQYYNDVSDGLKLPTPIHYFNNEDLRKISSCKPIAVACE